MTFLQVLTFAAATVSAPQPVDSPTWITTADYPPEALRSAQGGVVGYKVEIDAQGTVTACAVTESSGAPADFDNSAPPRTAMRKTASG